eukprot:SAG22_NODE_833_length_6929_cov_27.036159_2_plen_537_part_00
MGLVYSVVMGEHGNPLVKARCGPLFDTRGTRPSLFGGANPKWRAQHENVIKIKRHHDDNNTLTVEVLDQSGGTRAKATAYVGGNDIPVQKYMDSPGTEHQEQVPLFTTGNAGTGQPCGVLHVSVKWAPSSEASSSPRMSMKGVAVPAGDFNVTVLKAEGIGYPDRTVRDLTNYTYHRPAYMSLGALLLYVLLSVLFFTAYMAAPLGDGIAFIGDDNQQKLLDRIQGGNGDWNGLNTMVFLVTTFTTIGYGNQPSLVATMPPCQYPGEQTVIDAPYSLLMPPELRGNLWAPAALSLGGSGSAMADFNLKPLPKHCFLDDEQIRSLPECWVIAGDITIFDFGSKLMYIRDAGAPVNYTASDADLDKLELPGDLGKYGASCASGSSSATDGEAFACFDTVRDKCESVLKVWRIAEQKKNAAKVFTMLLIVVGIGLLGLITGVLGEVFLEFANRYTQRVEILVDMATMDIVHDLDPTGGTVKGLMVAFVGLLAILLSGTAMYSWLENMLFLDAAYFTVVTVSHIGANHHPCCPLGVRALP